MKLCNVVGARPQFVKYFPIYQTFVQDFESTDASLKEILVHTGQHYDYNMSKAFFDGFGIKTPDFHLEVGSGRHGAMTAEIIRRMEEILLAEKPDVVIVYGDTNSTIGAALATAKLNIPLTHVEAGLRSFNRSMPEEINRIATDHMADMLLCPCRNAVNLLKKEGFIQIPHGGDLIPKEIGPDNFPLDRNTPVVANTGDVMYDVLLHVKEKVSGSNQALDRLKVESGNYALMTIHRAENTDTEADFKKIVDFVNEVSRDMPVIFPIHPRTRKVMQNYSLRFADHVRIVDPVDYFTLVSLLLHSKLLLTDSGGMQKEAYWLGVPCITMREQTEWPETVDAGWNVLSQDYTGPHTPTSVARDAYGDGSAASRILQFILLWLEGLE